MELFRKYLSYPVDYLQDLYVFIDRQFSPSGSQSQSESYNMTGNMTKVVQAGK